MKRYHFLDVVTTKYFLMVSLLGIFLIMILFIIIIKFKLLDIDTLSKFVDSILKAMTLFVATLWALNRYFVSRTDVTKIRVLNPEVKRIPYAGSNNQNLSILTFWLEISNEGNSIINNLNLFISIEDVYPSEDGIRYKSLNRWPKKGTYSVGPIEPGSWSAINDAIAISREVNAIRIYLEANVPQEPIWTWHKTFDVSIDSKLGNDPPPESILLLQINDTNSGTKSLIINLTGYIWYYFRKFKS